MRKNCTPQKQHTRKTRRKKGFKGRPYCQEKKKKTQSKRKKRKKTPLQRAHTSFNWLGKNQK